MFYFDAEFTVEEVRAINQSMMERGKQPEEPLNPEVEAAMRTVHFTREEIQAAWAAARRDMANGD